MPITSTYLVRLRIAVIPLLAAALLLSACENREDSPIQADQDVLDSLTPGAGTADAEPSPQDEGASGGDDSEEDPSATEEVETNTNATVEPTVSDAVIGDEVTVTGAVATHLSDQVITLAGVTFAEQPADETLVIIPTSVEVGPGVLEENSLVVVSGKVTQIVDDSLRNIDEAIFDEHGEFLEGFRASWGILATEVTVAEAGE